MIISSVIIPVFRVTYRTEHQRMSHWQRINRNNLEDAVLMLYKGTCQRVSLLTPLQVLPGRSKLAFVTQSWAKGEGSSGSSISQGGLQRGTAWGNRAGRHQLHSQSTRQCSGLGSGQGILFCCVCTAPGSSSQLQVWL